MNIQSAPANSEDQSHWGMKFKTLCNRIGTGIKGKWRENKVFVLSLPLLLAAVIAYIVIHAIHVPSKKTKIAVMITIASLVLVQLMHLVMVGAWNNLEPKAKYVYGVLVILIAVTIVVYQIVDNHIGPALSVIVSAMTLMHGLTSVIRTLLQKTRSDDMLIAPPYDRGWDSISIASDHVSGPYDPVAMLSRMDYYNRSVSRYIHMMMRKEAEGNNTLEEMRAYLDVETARANQEATRADDERARANKEATRADLEAARTSKLSAKLDDQLKVIKKLKEDRRIRAAERTQPS